MSNRDELPVPSEEEILRNYLLERDNPPPLFNDLTDRDAEGNRLPAHYMYRIEVDLIPVTDAATQQLAKRCAELHDQFLATATNPDGTLVNPVWDPRPDLNRTPTGALHISIPHFLEFLHLYHHLNNLETTSPPARTPDDLELQVWQFIHVAADNLILTIETSLHKIFPDAYPDPAAQA